MTYKGVTFKKVRGTDPVHGEFAGYQSLPPHEGLGEEILIHVQHTGERLPDDIIFHELANRCRRNVDAREVIP